MIPEVPIPVADAVTFMFGSSADLMPIEGGYGANEEGEPADEGVDTGESMMLSRCFSGATDSVVKGKLVTVRPLSSVGTDLRELK